MSDDFINVEEDEKKIKHKVSREEFERRRKEKHKDRNKKRVILVLLIVAAVALVVSLVALGTGLVSGIMKKAGAKVNVTYTPKTKDVIYNTDSSALLFASGEKVYIYSFEQLVCYDENAVVLWKKSLENMASPDFTVMDDGIIAYDTEGSNVCAYNEDGLLWEKQIPGKVKNICYNSAKDIVAAVYEDEMYKGSVLVFKHNKNKITDLFTKNYSSQYPVFCAISENGRSVAISGISAEAGELTGVLTLVDTDGGDNYYVKYTEGDVLSYVGFVSSNVLCAAGTNQLSYIKNDMTVTDSESEDDFKIIKQGEAGSRLLAVATAEKGACVYAFGTGDGGSELFVADKAGKVVYSEKLTENISGVCAFGEHFVSYTESNIYFYDLQGKKLCSVNNCSGIKDLQYVSEYVVFVNHSKGRTYVEFTEQ